MNTDFIKTEMEYKVKISQTFLPYLLVLLVIIGVVAYMDQLSSTYSAETEVIAITSPDQSEQVALWQPELEEVLPLSENELSEASFQAGLDAYKNGEWQQARLYWNKLQEGQSATAKAWELVGRTFIKSQRYREALNAFQQSLAIDSTYIPALLNVGTAYAGLQQYQQAEAACRKAAALAPDHSLTYLNMGMILFQQQKWAAAIGELQKASSLERSELKAKSKYYRGVAHLHLQDTLSALRHFQEAKALRPTYIRPKIQEILISDAPVKEKTATLLMLSREQATGSEALVYFHLAQLHQQHNNPEAAGEFLHKALRYRPEDIDLKISLGKHYLQQNQLPEAEMLFKQILNLDSLLPQPYYFLARLEAQKNNPREAIGLFEKAIASADGNFPEAFVGKGIAEESMNNIESAILSYQLALSTWPDYPEAYYHLGQAYLANRQLQQAAEAYQKALTVQPGMARAWYGLGLTYEETGQADSARLSLHRALAKNPALLNARMALATLYKKDGDFKEAVAHFSQLLKQHPTYLPALASLGDTYRKSGQQMAALQIFERLVTLNPEAIEAKQELAYLYATQNKVKKAEELYEELVQAIPYDHRLRFNLALQYEQQAKYKAAIVQLKKVLELEPEYERASEKLEDIQDRLGLSPNFAYKN